MAARRLAMNVVEHCAGKLEAGIKQFLVSSISGDNRSLNSQIDHHEVIFDIYRCAPQILLGVAPYLTGELLVITVSATSFFCASPFEWYLIMIKASRFLHLQTDQLDTRLKAVGLVGDLFSLPGTAIPEAFQPIFSEFLKRLTDRVVEVRMCVLEHVKSCLLSNPLRAEAAQIIGKQMKLIYKYKFL